MLAFSCISGIITTNLGKTATFFKVAGREIRIHHSKSLPLLLTGERLFFCLLPGLNFPINMSSAGHSMAVLSGFQD
jgi:hypothetical protein